MSAFLGFAPLAQLSAQELRQADLRQDPEWEGFRNRLTPDKPTRIRQDFGWSLTRNAAGMTPGELGGRIQRAIRPARYTLRLPKTFTLDDRLQASGKLSVTSEEGSSGALIGWLNQSSKGWRTPNSLALRVDGNGGKHWLFLEYGTRHGRTGGKGAFDGERYQTTRTKPFPADGTPRRWQLTYDPSANEGIGVIHFQVDDRDYQLALRPEDRKDGAEFDVFGIWNQETTGGGMKLWLDDLVLNGRSLPFDQDPGWHGSGNRLSADADVVRPFHHFGYSRTTFVNATPGEIGGTLWRDERPSYFADRIDTLTLDDPLFASGKIVFQRGAADSAAHLGWFHASTKQWKTKPDHVEPLANQLSILIEGPSRVGHFFRPSYATSHGSGHAAEDGPLLRPDAKVHSWSLRYSPDMGCGTITVTLDEASRGVALTRSQREEGATFDRFGLFNVQSGGWDVKLYIDDLQFTSAR